MADEQNPYQSPQAIELSHGYRVAPSAGRGGPPFASGRVLAFVAMVMVAMVVLASLWRAASTYMQISMLERAAGGILPSAGEFTSNASRQYLAAILRSALYLVSAVTFVTWFYRVYRNLPALRNAHLAHAPSGAVWWWFVPIASLVVPCQIALEIWRGSDAKNLDLKWPLDVKWPRKPAPAPLVGLWWLLFLVMCIATYAPRFFGAVPGPRSWDSYLAESWVVLVAELTTFPAGVLAILFIRGVDRNQDERIRLVNERAPASLTTPTESRLSAFLDKISAPSPPADNSPFARPTDRP